MNTQDLIPSLDRETSYDAWMEAALDLEQAAHTLDLEPWIVERLRQCESELHSNLLLQCDDGSAHIKRAIHVAYTSVYPRSACELRISAGGGLNSTRTAAMRTTLAAALFAIDISGSATTLIADTDELSEHELHSLVDGFAKIYSSDREIADAETGNVVLAGEGVNDYVLAWLASANASRHISASDCSEAAAIALAHTIRKWNLQSASAREGGRTPSLRFAVQGMGEFGRAVARELVRKGATLVAVSDVSGGVTDTAGLDMGAIERHLQREEFILGYRDADAISKAELLACECDVLILAAGARHLNAGNGRSVRATLVVECAPDMVERGAFVPCAETGVPSVLPYLFISGLRLAAVVQQQDANPLATSRRCQTELKLAALQVLKALQKCADERGIPLAEAAPLLALSRISRQLRLQGI